MIYFDNMSKYYATKQGRHYVFKNVNIVLPSDINIAVFGPNGAGKSTLIRMMGGADMPNKGRIHSAKNISWPLGLKGGLQGSMSGRENVRFVARIHGYKNTKPIEKQVADFAEIGKFFDEPVKTYSSGMRSKVTFGLSMAFDFNFDVLLLDELSAVGDAIFKKKSEALLKERFGTTQLIMVSHSKSQLKKHCQAGLLIKDKTLQYFANIDEAIKEYQDVYVN
jgi:capsular polysaccharide transport system ATP-binding protein